MLARLMPTGGPTYGLHSRKYTGGLMWCNFTSRVTRSSPTVSVAYRMRVHTRRSLLYTGSIRNLNLPLESSAFGHQRNFSSGNYTSVPPAVVSKGYRETEPKLAERPRIRVRTSKASRSANFYLNYWCIAQPRLRRDLNCRKRTKTYGNTRKVTRNL